MRLLSEGLYRSRMAGLRRHIILRWMETVLLDGLLLFSLFCVPARLVERTLLPSFAGFGPYTLLLALAFLLCLLWRGRKFKSIERELIAIDLRLDLKERLSTAHEYHARPQACLLDQLLQQEAVDLLADLRKRRILAPLLGRRHALLPVAVILLIALHLADFRPILWPSNYAGPDTLDAVASKINRYLREQKESTSKDREAENASRMFQALSETAGKIDRRSAEPDKILQEMQRLTAEVQEDQSRILERLQSRLSPREGSDRQRAGDAPSEGKGIQAQAAAEQLLKKIRDKYGDQVPSSLSKDLESLETNRRFQRFLEQTADELRNLTGKPGSPDGKSKINKGLAADRPEKKKEPENEKRKRSDNPYEVSGAKDSMARAMNIREAGQNAGASEGRTKSGKPSDEPAATAGRGKGPDEKKEPYTLPTAKGPLFKDRGVSLPADYVNSYVRSLTKVGKASLTEEQLLRIYQQEIEEALQKEEIPISYRNYIKNYFLNIGLGKDEKEDDVNQ